MCVGVGVCVNVSAGECAGVSVNVGVRECTVVV